GMYLLFDQSRNDLQPVLAGGNKGEDYEAALGKIVKAMKMISSQYVGEVSEEQLIEGALQGMVTSLQDPHSTYMDQETASQFMESLSSHFEGIGAEVTMTNGQVTIVSPFRDSPAERAGILPNDRIVAID